MSGPVYTGHEPPALPSLRKGGKFDHRPERPKVLLRHCVIRAVVVDTGTALPAACDDANIVDYWYQSGTVSHVNVRMLGPRVPYSLPQEHMVPICSAAYGYPLERHCVAHLSTVSSGSVTRGPLTSGVVAESSKQPRYMYWPASATTRTPQSVACVSSQSVKKWTNQPTTTGILRVCVDSGRLILYQGIATLLTYLCIFSWWLESDSWSYAVLSH